MGIIDMSSPEEQKYEEDTTLLEKNEEEKPKVDENLVTFNFNPLIPVLLVVSFICNVIALLVPFITTEIMVIGKNTYNILTLIKEMWQKDIYVPTVLVVLFSVIFPFMKLCSMGYLYCRSTHTQGHRTFLRTLSYVGRFSLLDIFVELIVLTLAHDQGSMFHAETH